MTATERIRAMLDERGEYYETSGNRTWWGRPIDARTGEPINVFHNQAQPMGEDRLFVELQLATPEQAIEATLGRGTCRMEKRHMDWRCTGCGEIVGTDDPTSELFIDGNAVELWRYCPNCGRKVVDA